MLQVINNSQELETALNSYSYVHMNNKLKGPSGEDLPNKLLKILEREKHIATMLVIFI